MERRQDTQCSLPAEARQTVPESEGQRQDRDRERGTEREGQRQWGRERLGQRESASLPWQVGRHYWQIQAEHQTARLTSNKAGMAEAQADWDRLRSQALWRSASPGCLLWCWRWCSLPRRL